MIDHAALRRLLASSFPSLCLLFLAQFGALGMELPFFPAFLASHRLGATEISYVIAAGTLTRIALAPVIGLLADRIGVRLVLALAGMGACFALLLNLFVTSLTGFVATVVVSSIMLAPLNPLCDALAVHVSHQEGLYSYGIVRAFGSLGFLLAAVAGSEIITRASVEFTLVTASLLFLAMAAAVSGVASIQVRVQPVGWRESAALLRQPYFLRLVIVAGLILGSHVMNNTFSFILWTSKGISSRAAGWLWAEAVVMEVAVFAVVGSAVIDRLGTRGCMIAAASFGILRWGINASTVAIIPLVIAQSLQGLTFALTATAAISALGVAVPARLAASAQALFASMTFSVSNALLAPIAGRAFSEYGSHAFYLMSILCLFGLLASLGLTNIEANENVSSCEKR